MAGLAVGDVPAAQALSRSDLGWKEILWIVLLGITFTSGWAMLKGENIGWDQRNYHYYNAYALLSHKVTYHVAPAMLQSWINPLVYVPHYLLINHTSPIIAGSLFGAIAGINFVLVYFLARMVISTQWRAGGRPGREMAIGILAAAVGISGPKILEELGGTNGDITISLFVLAGLIALCRSHQPGRRARAQDAGYAACGFLLGAAAGLKLTAIVYPVGLTMTLLALWPRLRFGLRRFVIYSLSGVVGFLMTAGWWSWFLWREYGNPIFPFFNNVIHSPWVIIHDFRDNTHVPRSLAEAVSYPFQELVGNRYPTSDVPLRDARFALLFVLLGIMSLVILWRTLRRSDIDPNRAPISPIVEANTFWLIVIFFVSSYLVWLKVFGIQRYLMPVSLISGLVIFLLLDRLLPSHAIKMTVFSVLALFCMAWTRPYKWERLPYGNDWFGVELSRAASQPNTLFIMLGNAPMAYVVPFLPGSSRVIHLNTNFPLEPETLLGQQTAGMIASHTGPIRSIGLATLTGEDLNQLNRYGLGPESGVCESFRSNVDEFETCPLVRRPIQQSAIVKGPDSVTPSDTREATGG